MDMIILFVNWLKGLTNGEATRYVLLVTVFCIFLGLFIRWLKKTKTTSKPQSDLNPEDLSTPANIKIEIDKVKAKPHGTAIGVNLEIVNQGVLNIADSTPLSSKKINELERHYLNLVMKECAGLEWLSLVQQQDEQTQAIGLDAVYISLMTTTLEQNLRQKLFYEDKGSLSIQAMLDEDTHPLSALNMLDRESKLVLMGAPGSGKSTLINFIALCMAGQILGHANCNFQTLTRPLPDNEGKEGKLKKQSQHWLHGALLPLRIILRDFGVSNFFPASGEAGNARHLMQFIKSVFDSKGCAGYFPVLEQRLLDGKVLLMLDGLDEVAEAKHRRERLIQCIQSFETSYSDNRLLVTARPYAYQQRQWKIKGFQDTTLADFGPGQICLFVDQWYACKKPEFDKKTVLNRAEKLKNTILTNPALYALAQRPLLLTLMAFLHSNRHELPERRADLYESLLDLLIEKWEKARFQVNDASDAKLREQYSLAEYLQTEKGAIRKALERLAFAAHAEQIDRTGTADIPAKELSHLLFLLAPVKERVSARPVNQHEILEYLRDRVGILYQRGGDSDDNAVYTFPHRSFQEYLAASYLYREEKDLFNHFSGVCASEWQEVAAYLGGTEPDRWREVVVLAGSINSFDKPGPVWNLLQSLVPTPVDTKMMTPESAWQLRLAGEILADNIDRINLSLKHQHIMDSILKSLPHLLRTSTLPSTERVAGGQHLAKIGDPRMDVLDVDSMLFCPVPAGPFFFYNSNIEPEEWFGGGDIWRCQL